MMIEAPVLGAFSMPETTIKKFTKPLSFYETIVYTYIYKEGKGKTAHTIETQAVTANPRERKETKMNDRLRERIREFNRKAEQATADGYTVAEGYVWEG